MGDCVYTNVQSKRINIELIEKHKVWFNTTSLKTKTPENQEFLFFNGRDDWIRTSDPQHPMLVRYQAALHPERSAKLRLIFYLTVQFQQFS